VSLGKTYTEGVTDNGGSLITLPSKDQCSAVFCPLLLFLSKN
jgi:hypothetical protein